MAIVAPFAGMSVKPMPLVLSIIGIVTERIAKRHNSTQFNSIAVVAPHANFTFFVYGGEHL